MNNDAKIASSDINPCNIFGYDVTVPQSTDCESRTVPVPSKGFPYQNKKKHLLNPLYFDEKGGRYGGGGGGGVGHR